MLIPIFDVGDRSIDYYRNYKEISDDPENYGLCVARERWKEMQYSLETHGSVFIYNGEEYRLWYDNGKEARISVELLTGSINKVFIRSSAPEGGHSNLFKMMSDLGKITTLEQRDYYAHRFWPVFVPNRFTLRHISIAPREFLTPEFFKSKKMFFVKSVHKHWSFGGTFEEWIDTGACYSLDIDGGDRYAILSDYVDIDRDEYGKKEYRCFSIEDRITLSRYEDYIDLPVPESVRDFAEVFKKDVLGKALPRDTVFDIGLSNGNPFLIEVNHPCGSGRYIGNTPDGLFGGSHV